MSEFVELEYKYKADEVKLTDFVKLINKLNPVRKLDISSWDTYYTKGPNEFVRFRNSTDPELTIKRKVKDANNWQRIEVDLPVDCDRITDEKVDNFLSLLEYQKNFKIYKSCFIYWLPDVNYVYYIVYDENLKEAGRFIEVEVNKSAINKLRENDRNDGFVTTGDGAVQALNSAEKYLGQLGLSPQNRMKKSLFELFVKG